MSRLIVKNLPKSITVDKLKDTFSSKGTITDVQLKYTKDGKFRQFGFVGYKSEEEGKAALEYFNNTYLNASKITVELCADLGDPSKPKSWSKYASDSTAGKAKTSGKVKDKEKKKKEKEEEDDVGDILEKHKDDPLFVEYMETHLKSSKAAWSNDMLDSEKLAKISSKKSKKDSETLNDSGIDDENKGQKSGSEGDGCEEDLSEGDDDDDEAEDEGEGSEDEGDNKASIANKDISDFEYLQKLKGVQTDKKGEPEKSDVAKKKPKKEPIELFTVKIRGLGFKARKSHVRHFFHPLKPYSIRLPPRIKGIAYVGFRTEKELKQALGKNKGFLEKVRLEEYLLQLTKEEVEYGRYLEELQEDNVMCPLCGEHRLFVSYGADGMNQISCSGNCCLYKKVPYGLIEIRRRLEMAVETHSGTCVSLPGFTFTKEDSCLYLVCADCGTLYYVL